MAQVTIYRQDNTNNRLETMNIDSNYLSNWVSNGWSTSKPAQGSAPSPTQSAAPASTQPPVQNTAFNVGTLDDAKIDSIYQKYFGRPAKAAEKANFKGKTETQLLSQLRRDFNAVNIKNDSKVAGDQQMKTWIDGNASLLGKLFDMGYNVNDIINEAYAQTRYGHSSFSGDMTTTSKEANIGYSKEEITNGTNKPGDTLKDISTGKITTQDEINAQNGAVDPDYNYVKLGRYSLIKFSDDPTPNDTTDNDLSTVFLYDSQNSTYRPFTSEQSFNALFGDNAQEAWGKIKTLSSTVLNDEQWKGNFIPSSQGVQADGSMPEYKGDDTTTNVGGLAAKYGATTTYPDYEKLAAQLLGVALTPARQSGDISDEVWQATINNPQVLAKYVNAIVYGGYSISRDIYGDMKARQLAKDGNSNYANYKTFDETIAADTWYETSDGKKARGDNTLIPPAGVLNIDVEMFDNPIFQIPGAAFSELVKPIDWESDEFKAEAEGIQASYYDLLDQQVNAETDQARAVAKNNWDNFKSEIEKKYGYQLSDNAVSAWNQLQNLFSGMSDKGLGQSGLLNEATDRYLRQIRRSDERMRSEKTTTEEQQYRNYLLNSGTPEEISAFVAQNQEKAKAWGIIPDDDTRNWYSTSNLKSLYPDMSDKEIQQIHDTMLDENGNYRSALYKNLYTNKYGISQEKSTYQQSKLYEKKLDEEEKAYAPYTTGNPFVDYSEETPGTTVEKTGTSDISSWSINPANKSNPLGSSSDVLKSSQDKTYKATTPYSYTKQDGTTGDLVDFSKSMYQIGNNDYSSLTKIPDVKALKAGKYSSSEIIKDMTGNSIYLAPGVSKRW